MDIKVIPLSQLETNAPRLLMKCCDSGQPVVVELPDHRLVAIWPLDADDEEDSLVSDLIEADPGFRALLAKSAASPRKPFVSGARPAEVGSPQVFAVRGTKETQRGTQRFSSAPVSPEQAEGCFVETSPDHFSGSPYFGLN